MGKGINAFLFSNS